MSKIKNALLATLLAASGIAVGTGTASAADPLVITSGDGDTLRAIFYKDANFGGDQLRYYGGSSCTATTADTDYSLSVMPAGWNDVISSVRDYNGCDVNLFWNGNFGTPSTGYVHYGSGKNVQSGWNDKASSFRVS